MTNPNNAIGTNGAFGGRTSVNAFNDNLAAWTRGVLSGWKCEPDSGMTVALGGDPDVRDVAVAEDDAGNKTTINNISLAPVKVTIPGAPASNTRIDSIVSYVDNPPEGSADITDNYESCGIIVVSGTASATPVPPNESTIRSAITSDGAVGSTAYYVVLANISVENGTTDITAGEIDEGDVAGLAGNGVVNTVSIADNAVTNEKIADGAMTNEKIADNAVTNKKIDFTASADSGGWRKIQLSSNMNLYLKKGSLQSSWGVGVWRQDKVADKPTDLDSSNTFYGGAGGIASDHAINVCGFVEFSSASVEIQTQNIFNGSVSTTVYWWAYIVEIIS